MKKIWTGLLIFVIALISCSSGSEEDVMKAKVAAYFNAWNNQEFTSEAFRGFTLDTSYTWHSEKIGEGSRSIFNPNSGWKQWDKAYNGTYTFDSVVVNTKERTITGKFTETTDFLKDIGMPEGFAAIITYWYNEDLKVTGKLYGWNPNNRSMHDMVKPIVEWAKTYDSAAIAQVYLTNGFKPSTENAAIWKRLITAYKEK